ncbi:cytochrome P450 [Truncatella angustata]|uniref:Cytochrome P450 n=1 Tax=Truncatella angustata TaxID=152316 RepID=A0A9P8UA25_9PEZI|nr:cytochrome P450 [Truncatella angustata]KAH6646939.1 cytochrome P450 [Truncatella angustata]
MDLLICAVLAILELLVYNGSRQQVDSPSAETVSFRVAQLWPLVLVQYLAFKYYRIFIYPHHISPLRHLPGPQNNHFFLGQTIHLLRADTPTTLYIEWMKQYPDAPFIRYLSFANTEVLVPNSINSHKEVLQAQCYSLSKAKFFLRIVKEVAGHGLILMEGDEHKAHRRMLGNSFQLKNIRKLEPIFQDKAKDICRFFEKNIAKNDGRTGTFDCTDTFSKAILDIMGSAILGVDLDYVKPDEARNKTTNGAFSHGCTFHEAYDVFFAPGPIGKLLLFFNGFIPTRWLPLKANQEFLFAMSWLNDALTNIIRDRYRDVSTAMAAGNYEHKDSRDLVTFIVEESMPGGSAQGIGEKEFLGHLLEFMAAGHDTSANMLSWSCLIMATNHDIQDKLREEIRGLPINSTFAEIDKLPYLENFVKESLRVYSPATTYHREADVDLTIEGIRIPKGTLVDLCPSVTLLNPTIWGPDAEYVVPERWSRLTDKQTSPYAFNAFSNGPRICIGRQFALFEIKTILVEIIRNFRFLAVEKPFKVENPGFTLRPAGLEVKVERNH